MFTHMQFLQQKAVYCYYFSTKWSNSALHCVCPNQFKAELRSNLCKAESGCPGLTGCAAGLTHTMQSVTCVPPQRREKSALCSLSHKCTVLECSTKKSAFRGQRAQRCTQKAVGGSCRNTGTRVLLLPQEQVWSLQPRAGLSTGGGLYPPDHFLGANHSRRCKAGPAGPAHPAVVLEDPQLSPAPRGPWAILMKAILMIPWESTGDPRQRVEKAGQGWERGNAGAQISGRCWPGAKGGHAEADSECRLRQQLIASALSVPLAAQVGFLPAQQWPWLPQPPQFPPASPDLTTSLAGFHHCFVQEGCSANTSFPLPHAVENSVRNTCHLPHFLFSLGNWEMSAPSHTLSPFPRQEIPSQ